MTENNNEIVVELPLKPSKAEILNMIDEMIKVYDGLPPGAQFSPCTQSDLHSVLVLLSALFRAES